MRPGCYDPAARLLDMDRAGVLASMCFPTLPRFCGQLFMEASDRDFGFVCLQAYNDWLIDEWCATDPGRFIPLILIPMWDPPLAVKEMERCAAKGATTFAFSENPAPLGLPTIHDKDRYWDPVMTAANELELVISMHVGSSSQVPSIAPDSPFMANLTWGAMRTSGTMLSWIFSSMFQRFPNLKIALSEGEIGWIPYYLERAEQVLDKQKAWVQKGVQFMEHASSDADLSTLDVRAAFRDHVFGCFIDDAHGIASLEEIGVDNVMCETDYPHSDSTWPNCIEVVKHRIGHLSEETQYKLLRGNAERLYRFTPAEPPVLATA
jgi:predicted TIM-barrel fold metal-dependent hydrolase